jgi:hypothetical protein
MSAGVATRREGLLTDQGYMQITRLCNGWGAQPSPDPANGNMQLTIGFQDQTVDPVLWGTFTLCRYLGGSSQIQLAGAAGAASGPLNCYLGGPLPWANVGQTPLLFTVDFGVELNGAASLLQSAFRIDPVLDTIELLEHTSEGDLLVLLSAGSASLSQLLSVRAKNGNFSCDELARTCTSDTGATVSF